jgi:hypothetical protein
MNLDVVIYASSSGSVGGCSLNPGGLHIQDPLSNDLHFYSQLFILMDQVNLNKMCSTDLCSTDPCFN